MSPRHKNILVLADGSRASGNALSESIRLARWTGAKVTAVAVVPPYEGDLSLVGVKHPGDAILGNFAESLESALELAHRMKVTVAVTHVEGDPGDALPGLVEERGVDLLVLGVSGACSILNVLAGGVVTSLLGRCSRDLLFFPAGTTLGWERILFPAMEADLDPSTTDGVFEFAASYGGSLKTVALARGRWRTFMGGADRGVRTPLEPSRILSELQAGAARAGVGFQGVVAGGDPCKIVDRMSREEPAQLIVAGRRGKVGLRGLLGGFSLERLIHRAWCPVLALGPARGMAAESTAVRARIA